MELISFQNVYFLLGLLLVPLVIYWYYKEQKKKKAAALKFSSIGLLKNSVDKKVRLRKHLEFIILISAIILIVIGFADPHIPLSQTKDGVNVVLAIDTSGSMAATDYSPTRLGAAKNSATILIDSLYPKDNVGIVTFESGATTSAYLTPFKDKAKEKLQGIAQKQGTTAIGDGLAMAVDMATSIPNKKSVVILLSDGENNAGVISPDEAVQFAKTNKIQVYTVGIGTVGKTIVGYDWFGNPAYDDGLDENALRSIAENTGGKYFRAVDTNTLNDVYKNIGNDIKHEKELTSIKDWFFVASLICLLTLLYVMYGRYKIIR